MLIQYLRNFLSMNGRSRIVDMRLVTKNSSYEFPASSWCQPYIDDSLLSIYS